MKPVFISYSSKHRDLTRGLASLIEAQYGAGSVWWDHELESRASYTVQIKAALEQARVIVVIWTAGAMVSDYVYAEAVVAQAQGKLVNVRPADMSFRDIPEPFNIHHIDEAEDHERILTTIAKVMNGTPIPTRVPLHEIYFRQHGQRLIDPKHKALAPDPREISPTELLQAKFGVVPYRDVTGMAVDLLGWCTDGSRRIAGRLVYGQGGLGKTRLLIEVAATLRDRGWIAGFLDRPHEQVEVTLKQRWQALDQLIDCGDDSGLLIVMDYGESRQDEVTRLAQRLADRTADTRPIRFVLLARSAGDWWTRLVDEQSELERVFRGQGGHPDIIALPAIAAGQQRRELFTASREAFASVLAAHGYVAPTGEPLPERLRRIDTDAGYARPLAVQMEALLWLASAAPETSATGVDVLLRRVLGLEREHWKKLLGALDEERTRDVERGVAQITVVQGVPSRASAEQLLMADGFYGDERRARVAADPVVRNLSRVYGTADGGIAHLEPDLIGEHHVATVADTELLDGCLSWIEADPGEVRAKRRRDLLTVLQRATQAEHGASANSRAISLLDHLVRVHATTLAAELVAVMVDTPGALAHRLDRLLDTLNDDTLGAIDASLPLQSVSLMNLSLRLAERRAGLSRALAAGTAADATDQQREAALSHLAARVGTLGNRLSALGRREEALAASQEAAEIDRRLAASRPDAFLPDLARSLSNLSRDLSALGRREEALAASQEAVEIDRRLAASRPDAFLPDLAMSLSNLGIDLADLGRREEALAASQEAVEIYRRLAGSRPDAFLPDLARSLSNLGNRLSALGRREEALAASQEAVEIRRHLAASRPDAFLPNLASSLSNLGVRLSALGRREEALAASQEAVEIRRRLAASRPDAFLPGLAMSLSNLGNDLSALGRREEALAASQEAVEIRHLAASRPDAFLPDLAMSLNNLGIRLADLGRREEALAASQEAVEIRRRLAGSRPDAFLPDLAQSLNNLGNDLSDLGRREEALAASQEAVEIYRRLAGSRPDAFLPDLAESLNNLGNRLSDLGRREEALAASQEAAEIRKHLAGSRPDAFLPDLAESLNNLGNRLSDLGRREEAAQVVSEALEIVTPFVERYPQAYGELARTIAADVLRYNEAAAQAPDMALLERVAQALDRNRPDEANGAAESP